MRIACLLVPDLPLRAQQRAHLELGELPFVVASGTDGRAEVVDVSPGARRAGVRAGLSVAQARTVCSELRVQAVSPPLERAARQTLLDLALSFSPRAELAAPVGGVFRAESAVFLDASGVATLFGSEAGFASALAARAERLGLPARVAVASSRSIARLVTRSIARRSGTTLLVVPPGGEAELLAPLSVDLLAPSDRLAQSLTRFGVTTLGDLLRLPRRQLTQRLGPEVVELVARARGEEAEPPLPVPDARRFEEAIDLEFPVERLEPLRFVLRGLLSRLIERLELRGLACAPLDLELGLCGGGRDMRRVGVAAATLDSRVLLRLISLALETHPPAAAVETVCLATQGQRLRSDQLDFFRPRGPDPSTLDRAISELESLCGPGRVGSPGVADDHRPDAFELRPFRLRKPSAPPPPRSGSEGAVALRALRPPVSAEVRVDAGNPAWLRCAVAEGPVVRCAGPWRTTGRWWSEQRFAVDHFDVEMSSGTVLRLAFDWIGRRWQVDAVYD